MKKTEHPLTRRKLLKNAALMGLAGALTPLSGLAQTAQSRKDWLQPRTARLAHLNGSFNIRDLMIR